MPALIALLLVAAAPAGEFLDVHEGTLSYTVVHKLHEVRGVSRQVEGRALAQPDGTVRVQVRAKVASFDSGNENRDEHLREATHDVQHPYASVKGTMTGLALPLAAPAQSTLHAIVELNGGKQAVDVPVKLKPEGGGVRATFSFPISLGAFKVERPQLLFVKVDDRVVIEGDLLFRAAK
jgi:polyisoprenoid-binding protein YceI